jgi:hypothetical protein
MSLALARNLAGRDTSVGTRDHGSHSVQGGLRLAHSHQVHDRDLALRGDEHRAGEVANPLKTSRWKSSSRDQNR